MCLPTRGAPTDIDEAVEGSGTRRRRNVGPAKPVLYFGHAEERCPVRSGASRSCEDRERTESRILDCTTLRGRDYEPPPAGSLGSPVRQFESAPGRLTAITSGVDDRVRAEASGSDLRKVARRRCNQHARRRSHTAVAAQDPKIQDGVFDLTHLPAVRDAPCQPLGRPKDTSPKLL